MRVVPGRPKLFHEEHALHDSIGRESLDQVMGDVNQLHFIKSNLRLLKSPVIEIGSRDYGNTADLRPLFKGGEYVGIDMQAGKGVDRVLDLSSDFDRIEADLNGKKYKTIICLSVLEHCLDVYKVSQNIEKLLEPGGRLAVSVPFSWEYHGFPNDYWRFTPDAVKFLFKNILFDDSLTNISTSREGEVGLIDGEFFKMDLSPKQGFKKKRYGLLTACILKSLKTFHLMPEILDNIYVLPPVMVNMIGIKT